MKAKIITLLTVHDSKSEGGLDRIISFDKENLEFIFGYAPGERYSSFNALHQKGIDAVANTLKLTHSGEPLLGQSGVIELSAAFKTFAKGKMWKDSATLDSAMNHFMEIAKRNIDENSKKTESVAA